MVAILVKFIILAVLKLSIVKDLGLFPDKSVKWNYASCSNFFLLVWWDPDPGTGGGNPGRIGEEGVRRERKGWEVGVLKE